jgi:methylenetetrahydrofolate reductase (NADPH)
LIHHIRDILAAASEAGRPAISVEFFPTKSDEGERALLERTIPSLSALRPDFCSVTYGAGGGTRERTLTIVDRIQREHGITAMAHLTCVNQTAADASAILDEQRARGIKNVLALRGDPPNGSGPFARTDGGFEYAHELVRFIREAGGFSIGVAGFPEGHIACTEGKHVDWARLKHKIDQGADFVVTQLFFDNRHYFEFRDALAAHGVTTPIIPGILPILSTSQITRFVALCGAELPAALLRELEQLGDQDDQVVAFGIDYATKQCEELLREGAPGLHFYTLNKARSTTEVVRNLALDRCATGGIATRADRAR